MPRHKNLKQTAQVITNSRFLSRRMHVCRFFQAKGIEGTMVSVKG